MSNLSKGKEGKEALAYSLPQMWMGVAMFFFSSKHFGLSQVSHSAPPAPAPAFHFDARATRWKSITTTVGRASHKTLLMEGQ